ncbi:MAG: iron-containing alcohol dehydrogenase [Bacteroidales bacterium]
MVRPFQFSRLPLIFFGPGKLSLVPGLIKRYGTSVVLVTGKSSFLSSGKYRDLVDSFTDQGIMYQNVVISGEPSPAMVDTEIARLNKAKIDLVLSIGGGSVIDAGKAISAMLYRHESVKTYLEGVGERDHPGTKIPFIAVPTTSGTGSEATKNAVISDIGEEGFKKSLRHDNFVPDIAVVDPELTLNCPPAITAASGMDCFTQLTEAFLSDKSNEYTDAFAWEGIKAIKSSLLRSYIEGSDIEARSGMSFAALTSGICLANAGLGVVHGFASSIGGRYSIPHGVVCGTLMAPANAVTVRKLRKEKINHRSLMKYLRLGQLFLDEVNKTDDYYIDGFTQYLWRVADELGLPGLKSYGVEEKDIEAIADITETKNNPAKLDRDELIEILTTRL